MQTTHHHDTIRALRWTGDCLQLLDQRLLPHEGTYLDLYDAESTATAITDMVVRGAPAIGITAAYGVVLAARQRIANGGDWRQALQHDIETLAKSRPTAVNLFWALNRTSRIVDNDPEDLVAALESDATAIPQEDIAANRRMGELGASLIDADSGVLTHCNTGSLATGGYGTALGVIRTAFAQGKLKSIYADETRPWFQGARLTAWELVHDKIPVQLLADGAAAALMHSGVVQWVIVGSDRIAANGDVANKIGTYNAAIAARYHGVKFMVVTPSTTVGMELPRGDQIPIESRSGEEVLMAGGNRIAAPGAGAWNPVFDVTPAHLVDAIVTERGIVEQPDTLKMAAMMGENGTESP